MSRDLTRDRKLKACLWATLLLFLGLAACLAAAVHKPELGMMLAGLYVPFVGGIGAALALFIQGNVKVHQATAGAQP